MTKDKKQIIELINEGLSIIKQMNIRSDSFAGPNTRKLKETIKRLFPLIVNEYPLLSDILSNAEKEISILKQQLKNYKKQKQGLMQKLLTGQWRV